MLRHSFPLSTPSNFLPIYFRHTTLIPTQSKSYLPYGPHTLRQPFHLVEYRPWPLISSLAAFNMTAGLTAWFHNLGVRPLLLGLLLTILRIIQWWRDVVREATFQGHHTSIVLRGLKFGIVLFIISEVIFFFAFFWGFFHSRLAPTPEISCTWPPPGIEPINPFSVPLLNTATLLASGVTVTWAHHSLTSGNNEEALSALIWTVLLGVYFTYLQANEYYEAPFTIADGIYGTTFFVSTGFHGLHVLIGTTFLIVCLFRTYFHHFSRDRHFGFEAAAWYWHFVDVVWIFLYLCIYWWGS